MAFLVLLGNELGLAVGHFDVELRGALQNLHTLLGTDILGDLGTVALVVHEEHVEVLDVVHHKLVEFVRQQKARFSVRSIANARQRDGATELATHTRVDTTRLAPIRLELNHAVRLVATEHTRTGLLHNFVLVQRLGHAYFFFFFFL